MTRPVIRFGDPGSHGGTVVSGSPKLTANGMPVARVGDTYACPIHGSNPISSGSPDTLDDGRPIARVGDATACGATLMGGSSDVTVN